MTDQWRELKETITELRDNDGTGTQQEVCKFLANYMDVLEKQMIDPIDRVLETIELNKFCRHNDNEQAKEWNKWLDDLTSDIKALKGGEQE